MHDSEKITNKENKWWHAWAALMLFLFLVLALSNITLVKSLITRAEGAYIFATHPEYREMARQLAPLNDIPSSDVTPISFSVYGTTYKVPRNYITKMDNWGGVEQRYVSFAVTYPEFKPYGLSTKECISGHFINQKPDGCHRIEFKVGQPSDFTDEEYYENSFKNTKPTPVIKKGCCGFEMYELGTSENKQEYYRKKTSFHTLLLNCFTTLFEGQQKGVCTNFDSNLPNGNSVSYILDYILLPNAEKIDDGIRVLVSSFTVQGE